VNAAAPRGFLGLERRHWLVLLAAWLGWGFDVFDALLFNYVAPNCIPTLLGLAIGSAAAKAAIVQWNGILTSLLLVGWALGGLIFGQIADRIGRARALLLTILIYALATTACAFAPNLTFLIVFRVVASLGIGGEWAAGATLVAETVPESRRMTAGAMMQSASPCGLFLAMFVNYQIAGIWFADDPAHSWRYVFLCGLLPAAAVLILRLAALEPISWKKRRESEPAGRLSELFGSRYRYATLSALSMSVVALITWWTFNAFLPTIASGLALEHAERHGIAGTAALVLAEQWKLQATLAFNLGGLIGSFLTAPVARRFGRRGAFACYFLVAGLSLLVMFGLQLDPLTALRASFFVGLAAYGVFGIFAFYLPELFPPRLRATGAGFAYNFGRVFAAGGPFLVGWVAMQGVNATASAVQLLFYVGFVPILALILTPMIPETKGRALAS
jgi:MFS family permease